MIVLSSDGSAFQALGAATMNALSAVRVLVLAMTKSPRLVERNLDVDDLPANADCPVHRGP